MKSWSSVKKVLEEDRLAPSLRGRVSYFVTRYREAHDDQGRLAIRVDGEELFRAHPFDVLILPEEKKLRAGLSFEEYWNRQWNYELEHGIGEHSDFYRAFAEYDTQDIEKSLVSDNPLVRVLAVLDRRVGKRRLIKLAEHGFAGEPEWVQAFYSLRLEAEGLVQPARKPSP